MQPHLDLDDVNVAIVHDYLAQAGGAERVVASLHDLVPKAPVYTSVYDANGTFDCFRDMDVRTSYLQRWPFSSRRLHKLALFLYPGAFESFDFSQYDLVISSSSSFAKGIITKPETCHVCYCHTPTRFAWHQQSYTEASWAKKAATPVMSQLMGSMRGWDLDAARRADYVIANSHNVARRIRKYYQRPVDAVIHPPVETSRFQSAPVEDVGDHFLVVSRLIGYKRIDLAIHACNRLGKKLRIIGTGPELASLQKRAGSTITFCGRLPDKEVTRELSTCQALIFPGDEDFGITPLEAMASGRPVVAYGCGGALETVIDGQTGLLFRKQSVESLCDALVRFDGVTFNPRALEEHARKFDTRQFHAAMRRFLVDAMADHREVNSLNQFSSTTSLFGNRRRSSELHPIELPIDALPREI